MFPALIKKNIHFFSGKKNFESQKWTALKQNLRLNRIKTQEKIDITPRESPWRSYSDESLSGNSEREDSRSPKTLKQSKFPSINDRKISLVQANDNSKINYSLI